MYNLPSDFISELFSATRKGKGSSEFVCHTFILFPVTQSGMITDTDSQHERTCESLSGTPHTSSDRLGHQHSSLE